VLVSLYPSDYPRPGNLARAYLVIASFKIRTQCHCGQLTYEEAERMGDGELGKGPE